MPRNVRHGFVLLEAVVALLIIGIASAAALDLFSAHLRAAARQPALLTAAALAHDRMTALRLLSPEELRHLPDSLKNGDFAAPLSAYHWRASAGRSREESLYDLRIDVAWSGGSYALVSAMSVPPEQTVTR